MGTAVGCQRDSSGPVFLTATVGVVHPALAPVAHKRSSRGSDGSPSWQPGSWTHCRDPTALNEATVPSESRSTLPATPSNLPHTEPLSFCCCHRGITAHKIHLPYTRPPNVLRV